MKLRAFGVTGLTVLGLTIAVIAAFAMAVVAESPSPSPSPAASPSASPSSSRGAPTSPSPGASTSPLPEAVTGTGSWAVSGATVKLGGSLAGSVDSNGNKFSLSATGTRGAWSAKFGVQGNGPVTVNGVVTGPGPVIDATLMVFGVPVGVKGTPGTDLSVSLGLSRKSSSSILDDSRLAAEVARPPVAAETPAQVFDRLAIDWLRGVVAFTIVGWLLLVVAPGLKGRALAAINSLPFSRLGIGAILALDIPLASLVVIAIGLPLGLWWLGLLGLLMFLALAVAGYAYTGFQLGRLAFDRLGWAAVTPFAAVPVGVAAICLVGQIPYAGPFLSLLATVYGIGSMLYAPRAQVVVAAPAELAEPARQEQAAPAGRRVVE